MNSPINQDTLIIARELLSFLLDRVHPDGYLGDGDRDVLTHHLLLVVRAWRNESLRGVEDRAVDALVNLEDYREEKETDFNPFKLISFVDLNRADLTDYVQLKMRALRKYHCPADGYAVLQLGFTLSGDVAATFPTLVATETLLKEGSAESIEIAERSLRWSRKQIDANVVYENVHSVTGFAAYVARLYEKKTNKTEFKDWSDTLLGRVLEAQDAGLWRPVQESEKEQEYDKYQSAYLFYDLAQLHNLGAGAVTTPGIESFLKRLTTDFFEGDTMADPQQAVLLPATILRGLALLIPEEEKAEICRGVFDRCVRQSAALTQSMAHLQVRQQQYEGWMKEFVEKRFLPINPSLFDAREVQQKSNQVFVLMPFGEKTWYFDLRGHLQTVDYDFDRPYRSIIEPAIKELGLKSIRADDIYASGLFMQKIWRQILESHLVIADLTSWNPNVLYELGIAHTIGKPVVLLTQDERYVPADLRAIEYILYSRDLGNEKELQEKLTQMIQSVLNKNAA
jgi:hypothetical protein